MARDEDMERRLNNWARWKVGVSSATLGYAQVDYTFVGGGNSFSGTKIPVLGVEAEETDRAIKTLDHDLQRTLWVVYVSGADRTVQERALGCGARAIQLRVERAHVQLKRWITEENRRWGEFRRMTEARVKGMKGRID